MADPIGYTPTQPAPGVDAFTPEDDAARLLRTLSESGTLRTLNGLFDRFADVLSVALVRLDTPEGRDAISNLTILAKALGKLDADGTNRFVNALGDGLGAAGQKLAQDDDPPNVLRLATRLRDPDVRRGLDAGLAFLAALGQGLEAGAHDKPQTS